MRWRWLAVGFGLLSLGLVAVGVSSTRLQPHTYREAVMQVLDERQIAYDDVRLEVVCPPTSACLGATTTRPLLMDVVVAGPQAAHGQLVCPHLLLRREYGMHCMLSLTELDVHDLPLPPLANEMPWLALLRQAWRDGQAWWRR